MADLIPSRDSSPEELLTHPKVSVTVERVLHLREKGEKVLVFGFYHETCKALYTHIHKAVQDRTLSIAQEKLGGEYAGDDAKVQGVLARIARRFSDKDSPFYKEAGEVLAAPLDDRKYDCLRPNKDKLIKILAAYFRAPSFLARYLPLDDPAVQLAVGQKFELDEGTSEAIAARVPLPEALAKERSEAVSGLPVYRRLHGGGV